MARRRSSRLSGRRALSPASAARLALPSQPLESLIEREETPLTEPVQSIDSVLSTPATSTSVSRALLHPETVHQTTTKAPDSALRLGFASPRKALIDTPSKTDGGTPRQPCTSPKFDFKFAHESNLSSEAQKLMDNVREEAARIKAQMQAEKETQHQKDIEAEQDCAGVDATGRKIAQPKGKAGRFSDVHKAQFRKMDSIANHASAFRARPGFAQPTQQSLKRSGSKAGLDEAERPRTAGKGTPGKLPPPFMRPTSAASPFKSSRPASERSDSCSPAKRLRQSEADDVSTGRQNSNTADGAVTSSLPRPITGSIFSPTKSSLARTAATKIPISSSEKTSTLSRAPSVKSLKSAFEAARPTTQPGTSLEHIASPSKIPRLDSTSVARPLPPLPDTCHSLQRSQSTKTLSPASKSTRIGSKLPTFAGLKSILRPSARKAPETERVSSRTPKRPSTADAVESAKKVDFTPSVKSRYAVKLAANSPSSAKHDASKTHTDTGDSTEDEEGNEDEWEDAESEIEYPALPPAPSSPIAPVVQSFAEKAKSATRRESKDFKSIFTTLHPRASHPANLTSVNTLVNKTDPSKHAKTMLQNLTSQCSPQKSPSTIRRVRNSDALPIQPFEDTIQTVPHGLPGKKRRRNSIIEDDKFGNDDDAKENRRMTIAAPMPGGWELPTLDEDDGESRGGKRMRVAQSVEPSPKKIESPRKSTAREVASKNAKERKRGFLNMTRLAQLAQPKGRK